MEVQVTLNPKAKYAYIQLDFAIIEKKNIKQAKPTRKFHSRLLCTHSFQPFFTAAERRIASNIVDNHHH